MWREWLLRIATLPPLWYLNALRSKLINGRLMLSFVAFIAIVAILFEHVFQTTSIDAVVSAPLVQISAPIAGRIDLQSSTGQTLIPGQIFAEIVDERPDDRSLQELLAQQIKSHAALAAFDQELATLASLHDEFLHRATISQQAERQRLQTILREAEVTLPGARAQLELNQSEQQRTQGLVDNGSYHPVRLLDAKKNAQHAASEVERLESVVLQKKGQLAALANGAVIGEGFDDEPYSQQRVDEVAQQIAVVKATRDQAKADSDAADTRVTAEKERFAKATRASLSVDFRARVWTTQTGPGAELKESTQIAALVNCDQLFVEATLPERLYDHVHIDDPVRIRLYGADHSLKGKIRDIRGQGAPTSLTAAVTLERSTKKIMSIDIGFDGTDIAELSACPVGRSGTVYF